MNYSSGYINGYKLEFSTHAKERAIERFKALGMKLDDRKCVELAEAGVYIALSNKFMTKYISNYMNCHRHKADVLILDKPNKMVYAVNMDPSKDILVVKTIGTTHCGKWEHRINNRICWIYDNAFKFTTINGNVTWY